MKRNLKVNDVFNVPNSAKTFLVLKTQMTGGGTGHGPHDVYPDGHHVTAVEFDTDTFKVGSKKTFYQSGCFTGMIYPEDVNLVGTAETELVVKNFVKA